MTVDLYVALEEQIPAIDAERALQAAEPALYPQLTPQDARSWYESKRRVVNDTTRRVRATAQHFTINGVATTTAGLRRWLRGMVGGGLGR